MLLVQVLPPQVLSAAGALLNIIVVKEFSGLQAPLVIAAVAGVMVGAGTQTAAVGEMKLVVGAETQVLTVLALVGVFVAVSCTGVVDAG